MFFKARISLIGRLALILTLLGGMLGAVPAASVHAAALTVTTTNDSGPGSLRQAIADLIFGGTIIFHPSLAGQTITLASNLEILEDLTIDGSGLSPQITISGGNVAHIKIYGLPTVTISNLTISDGYSSGSGGAIYSTGNLTLRNITLRNNRADRSGGGVSGSNITVLGSTLTGNIAGSSGGAISGSNITLIDSTLSRNITGSRGGAVSAPMGLMIMNSTINQNHAAGGGALEISGIGSHAIINSTITENQATVTGGAIFTGGTAQIDISNSSIVHNNAPEGSEISASGNAVVVLSNTILACIPETNDCINAGDTVTIASPYSIIGVGPLESLGLAELADNGGPTQTMALLPGSPLLDAGDDESCAVTDQRGIHRPQGAHCDIGAFEFTEGPIETVMPTYYPSTSTATPIFTGTATPTATPTTTSTRTPTSTGTTTATASATGTPTNTATPTFTPTITRTPTVSSTPTVTGTAISNCDAIYHGPLTINGQPSMSMNITNQTGFPLAVESVTVHWNHDKGHDLGVDKALRLQQASLNGIPFWSGDVYAPSYSIAPSGLFIPPGNSTLVFTFHQTYHRHDYSERIFINLGTNGCQSYPIDVAFGEVRYTPTTTPTTTSTGTPTDTPTATASPTPTPTFTPSSTPTKTLTPTSTPSYSYQPLYFSLSGNQTFNGLATFDEDIIKSDGHNLSIFFDGSDVGVGSADLSAFSIVDADTILMSFDTSVTVNGITAAPQDVLRFDATSLGSTTAGAFSLYFDGSDVGLDASSESIDSLAILPDGQLLLSTSGDPSISGVTGGRDEDALAFTSTSLGSATAGTWSLYFDGSDVGLGETNDEDIDALDVTANGNIFLSALGNFAVSGVSGADEDVFICTPNSLGDVTACFYSPFLYFDGSTWGLTNNDVDGFSYLTMGPPPTFTVATSTSTVTRTPTAALTRTPTATQTPTMWSPSTSTSTATPTQTGTPTNTPTRTPTATWMPSTSTPTFTLTPTSSATSTVTPSRTSTKTSTPTNTPDSSDVIFADDFESGDFAAWPFSSIDANNMSVVPAAALSGSQGLRIVIDDNNPLHIADDRPNAESHYRARFYFDPNGLAMASGNTHYIFTGVMESTKEVVRLSLRYANGSYHLSAGLLNDSSNWANTSWFPLTDSPHMIELEWQAASAPGANNGQLGLWLDGAKRTQLTNIDNDTHQIDLAVLGPYSGIDTGTRGNYFFDAFESRRTTYIGP